MGVDVRVGGATAAELAAIARLFADWERAFSRFRGDSELNRVNRDPAGVVVLSRLFAWVLREALGAAAATGGLVDPTLGQAIAAAGYDRDFSSLHSDDPSEPGPAQPGQWRSASPDGPAPARPAGFALDLNGVVKALAVDDALACIAGDGLRLGGRRSGTRGAVNVAVPGGEVVQVLEGGVATSGSVRRRWTRGGVEQHHLIDPRTGCRVDRRGRRSRLSEPHASRPTSCAKAAFLLGDEGPAWLDERRCRADSVARPRGRATAPGPTRSLARPRASDDKPDRLVRGAGRRDRRVRRADDRGRARTDDDGQGPLEQVAEVRSGGRAPLRRTAGRFLRGTARSYDCDRPYLPFSPIQVLVPLTARYRPLWTGLGIAAAELLIALALTNHYRRRLPYRFWRRAHYLNFAVWALALVHGLTASLDRVHDLGAAALRRLGLARARAARPPRVPSAGARRKRQKGARRWR